MALAAWKTDRYSRSPKKSRGRRRGRGSKIGRSIAVTAPKDGRPFVCEARRRGKDSATMRCVPEPLVCMGRSEFLTIRGAKGAAAFRRKGRR